ncbi:Nmad5 family putative nucleotide modification protein [Microbulbifer sp. JSM ZJ756]|uniref:Nmad5 family putative nucleotide modification protein n=1 Tax=Microbulbifer sp. JSM ZJ756 TaxID=3376191 RepID=UPI0037A77A3F
MKSFPITKEMRQDIAQRLTSKAVQAEVDAIAAEAEHINKRFWKQYEKKLRAASGVPSTKWPELIRIGMARSVHTLVLYRHGKKNNHHEAFTIEQSRTEADLLRGMLTTQVKGKLFTWLGKRFSHNLHLKACAGKAMPDMNEGNVVTDPDLLADIDALQERVKHLFSAVRDFHFQTETVLASCRTAKQMRELFPEGAKLLPQPQAPRQDLAPTELAASVTDMLRRGVPPVKAA